MTATHEHYTRNELDAARRLVEELHRLEDHYQSERLTESDYRQIGNAYVLAIFRAFGGGM